jgi:hypothetical protein
LVIVEYARSAEEGDGEEEENDGKERGRSGGSGWGASKGNRLIASTADSCSRGKAFLAKRAERKLGRGRTFDSSLSARSQSWPLLQLTQDLQALPH